jgi:hypothetical protein
MSEKLGDEPPGVGLEFSPLFGGVAIAEEEQVQLYFGRPAIL